MATDNSPNKSETKQNDEISIKDLVLNVKDFYTYLLSKWLLIIVFVVGGGIIGIIYSNFKKPSYTAKTTFVLEEGGASSGLGSLGGLASMVGIEVGGGGGIFQGDNILELYRSRTMIEKTLLTPIIVDGKKQLLIDHYIELNHLRDKWLEKSELKAIKFSSSSTPERPIFTRLQDSVLASIVNEIKKNYLSVGKLDKKLSIISAEVRAPDELFAKAFNEQIVKNVNDFYVQTKTKKSLENVIILQQKTDSVRTVMNGNIYTAAAVSDATPNLNPTRQVNRVVPVQRSQFSAETNRSILGELVKNLELSKISLRKETPLIQVIDMPILPLEMEKIGKLKGFVLGGIIAGILIVFVIMINRIFKGIMS